MKQSTESIIASFNELLEMAKEEEVKQRISKWSLLAPTIIELHDNKNFTYKEIADWILLHKGIEASSTSVYQAYKKYKQEK